MPRACPGPDGAPWHDANIRGRPRRGDGLLHNPVNVGLLVWNRHSRVRDPLSGQRVLRAHAAESIVETAAPEMRIIDDALSNSAHTERDRARPMDHLSAQIVVGLSADLAKLRLATRVVLTRDQSDPRCQFPPAAEVLAIVNAGHQRCRDNRAHAWQRRQAAASVVLAADRRKALIQSFDPGLQVSKLAAEVSSGAKARQDALRAVERKIANLVEAIADGIAMPGVQAKLDEFEAQRRELEGGVLSAPPKPPALHPNLSDVYASRVATLREALDAGDGDEVLEAARALIDTVVVSPPDDPGDPPRIELTGNLMAMLRAGGVNTPAGSATFRSCRSAMIGSSTKGEVGEKFASPPASSTSASTLARVPPWTPHATSPPSGA